MQRPEVANAHKSYFCMEIRHITNYYKFKIQKPLFAAHVLFTLVFYKALFYLRILLTLVQPMWKTVHSAWWHNEVRHTAYSHLHG